MKKGSKVRIIAGPRQGTEGVIDLVVSNGAIVKMPDGKFHTVQFIHLEEVK